MNGSLWRRASAEGDPPPFLWRFRTRLFLYLMTLSLLTSTGSAALYYWRQLGFVEKDRSRRAHTLLANLASQSELGAYAGDPALCEGAARSTFAEDDVVLVAIYDRRAREILRFAVPHLHVVPPTPALMRQLLGNADARNARGEEAAFDDLFAPIVTGVRDPAEAIASGPGGLPSRREVIGVARIGLSHRLAREQLAEVVRWGVYLGIVLLTVGVFAALLISRLVSRPIAALSEGVEELGAGHLDTRVDIRSHDEIGQLGHAFNRMAARLAETMGKLEAFNRDLEILVARRTQVIQRAAGFTELLNAPLGARDAGPFQPPATEQASGAARGMLARLLHLSLRSLSSSFDGAPAAVLLNREDTVEFELEISWCMGAAPEAFRPLPPRDAVGRAQPSHDGRRLIVPLLLGAKPQGALLFLGERPPGPETQDLLRHAAAQLAIAVANVRAFASQQHLARVLQERNTRLQEMNRLKSEFLANTSHELRTPLNAILGYAELVLDGIYGEVSPEQRTAIEGIDESGRNLLLLINQILDLSKVEAGKMTVRFEEVDLVGLSRAVIAETAHLAKDRPYKARLVAPDSLPWNTDGAKVKQILINLLSNAIKFTARGSVEATITVGADGCAIAVRDTGIGIRAEDLRLIFEEFRQVDGSYSRAFGGTGLGLSIALRLARLIGATIEVDSRPAVGSTFTLRIPREPPEEAATPRRPLTSTPPPA